jgi:hypothetical protein
MSSLTFSEAAVDFEDPSTLYSMACDMDFGHPVINEPSTPIMQLEIKNTTLKRVA